MKSVRRHPAPAVVLVLFAAMGVSCTSNSVGTTASTDATAPAETVAIRTVSQQEALGYADADAPPLLLDVRTEAEFAEGRVPGAVNIPHTALAERLGELEAYKERGLVVYCRSGRRAGLALDVLTGAGFKNLGHLEGDMLAWQAEQLPLEK